jgi:hypothetical protein
LGGDGVDNMIRKIVSIDKEAENYREANKKLIEKERENFEKQINKMKQDYINELNLEKKKITEEKISEAQDEVRKIKLKNDELIGRLEERYAEVRENLVEEFFNLLKDSMKEGLEDGKYS